MNGDNIEPQQEKHTLKTFINIYPGLRAEKLRPSHQKML